MLSAGIKPDLVVCPTTPDRPVFTSRMSFWVEGAAFHHTSSRLGHFDLVLSFSNRRWINFCSLNRFLSFLLSPVIDAALCVLRFRLCTCDFFFLVEPIDYSTCARLPAPESPVTSLFHRKTSGASAWPPAAGSCDWYCTAMVNDLWWINLGRLECVSHDLPQYTTVAIAMVMIERVASWSY